MDFNSSSISPNFLVNSMSLPSYSPQYHQENKEANNLNLPLDLMGNSASQNLLSNSLSAPSYPIHQRRQENREEKKLRSFWEKQLCDIQVAEAFKSQQKLPLTRIKRIMKSNAEVQMVSAETPLLMSKACEIFIQELTLRAWLRAEESNKITLMPCDVAKAIVQTQAMQFLIEEQEQNAGNIAEGSQAALPQTADFMGNLMMNMNNQEENVGNIAEGSQAALPYTAGFIGNPMMNMGNVLEARNQLIPQPNIMQPPFMSSDQYLPYNFHPQPNMMTPTFMPSDQLPYNFHPKST